MNAPRSSPTFFSILITAILLLLSACQPAPITATQQPTLPPSQPTSTLIVLPTQNRVQPTATSGGAPADIILDYAAVAQNVTNETLAVQPASADEVYQKIEVPYRRVTLQGYSITNDLFKPQIFIYPVADLAKANENAGKAAADLQALLQTYQAGDQLPFLPLVFSSKQAMHAQVMYLDFKSGKGVRFLTQYNNGLSPVNNRGIVYSFQGLTSDGKYYVSAVLPVNHPELPADAITNWQPIMGQEYTDYLAKTATMLDQQPAASFSPDLSKLDAMVSSIEVK